MKIFLIIGLCAFLAGGLLVGCGKKTQSVEQLQEPLPLEVTPLSTFPSGQKEVEIKEAAVVVPEVTQSAQSGIPLPPQGPYKPSNTEIQTALKHAGYYQGAIDGVIGPQSKKAIEDFQKANNLAVDGKVGPKTWAALSEHLNLAQTANTTTINKKQ